MRSAARRRFLGAYARDGLCHSAQSFLCRRLQRRIRGALHGIHRVNAANLDTLFGGGIRQSNSDVRPPV